MEIYLKDIIRECNAKKVFGDESICCKNFSKDTRTINKSDVYIGIKGENFDGNSLYKEALEKGASVCILQGINEDEVKELSTTYEDKCAVVLVEDTIKALQQIASYKRSLYNIPVIAITGSVGKTSTKDIVASVVGMKYKVFKTQGNLNNHIGVPLTVLSLDDHEALVVEMGMNNLGEISVLSKIAKPTVAIITNVGTAHIGNLGSRENIRKAKLEILDGMQDDGVLIINNDNDMLHDWFENEAIPQKVATYGIENKSDVMAKNIELLANSSKFKTTINNEEKEIEVPVGGIHFVYNALCAITVATVIGVQIDDAITGIKNFELSKSRMELIKLLNEVTLINDCYNANYDSMKASIEYLSKTSEGRKIAVLGDMLELGEFSESLHQKVGEEVRKNKIDILITVGEMGKVIAAEAKKELAEVYTFDNNQDAISKIKEIMKSQDTILVKASNGMHFAEIVEKLK